jgi:hypothetical protein
MRLHFPDVSSMTMIQRILRFSFVLALVTATVAGLSAIHAGSGVRTVGWQIVSRFVVVQVYGFFGLFMARDSGIEGSLFVGNKEWSDDVRGIVNWGILPGLVIGVINYLFFFAYRYSPFVLHRRIHLSVVHHVVDAVSVSQTLFETETGMAVGSGTSPYRSCIGVVVAGICRGSQYVRIHGGIFWRHGSWGNLSLQRN